MSTIIGSSGREIHGYRYEGIDCLRGIAIISVVVYHFFLRFEPEYLRSGAEWKLPNLPFWLGVELFFIVSGFCIAFTLERARDVTGFWAMRLARLQPAYMAAAVVTFVVVGWAGLPGREADLATLVANLVWLNGAGLAPHVDGVYWSLVVELKFYLLIGVVWAFAPDSRAATLLWAGFCALSVIVMRHDYVVANIAMLYPWNLFFLFGMLLHNGRVMSALEQIGCIAVVLGGIMVTGRYSDVMPATMAVLALAAILMRVRHAPGFGWLARIGILSYAWYLLHQNIGVVIIREMNGAGLELFATPAAVFATLAMAAALHHALELRFRAPLARAIGASLRALRVESALARFATPVSAAVSPAAQMLATRIDRVEALVLQSAGSLKQQIVRMRAG